MRTEWEMELTKSLRLNSQTETESSSLTYFEEQKNLTTLNSLHALVNAPK